MSTPYFSSLLGQKRRFSIGLKIRVSPVQLWPYPITQTPVSQALTGVFSCPYIPPIYDVKGIIMSHFHV